MHRYFLFFAAILACASNFAFAQIQILVNVVGYEKSGAKRAVIQSSTAIADTKFEIINAQGNSIASYDLGTQTSVKGWNGRIFKVADFSDFEQEGKYKLKIGSTSSPEFSIGEKILQKETGAFQVSFFYGMRNTDAGDRNLAIRGGGTHNIYGGWWDATGDPGKHLSHLSYANYFNPQQIPLVVWALLQAVDFQPTTVFANSAKAEAAWGADYLLRSLSTAGYFYMSVFDNWGGWGEGTRQICAWSGSEGVRSTDYQSAMREGGGVSIAALARAYKAGISGDSTSAQYLLGAERAYAHLKANPTRYQDDGIENIIDDYTGLLAASELYNATQEPRYLTDAQTRADSLIALQSKEGWFYSDRKRARPFYHAADEGLPVVALARYVEVCKPDDVEKIRQAINKNFQWYKKITYQDSNPFEYVKMYGTAEESTDPSGPIDLARNGTATASRSEGAYTPDKAIDGDAQTRWSSFRDGATDNNTQWIIVDLGKVYKVNKVILKWERSYGKAYNIDVSTDKASWTTVAAITGNTQLDKVHSFDPINAQYVRMDGKERGYEYGGFSLYSFEIYGEQDQQPPTTPKLPARFFMPHTNETKYWWQGENARIASLAAAFAMGAQLADPSGELWYNTLFALASAQLDWILGKNPFAAGMMHGFGPQNSYPNYPGLRALNNIKGGICNGITAKHADENDLEWSNGSNGDNWRWIEQWLPHNAWYLTAISAISYRIENPIIPPPEPPEPPESINKNNFAKSPNFKISVINGRNVNVELPYVADGRTSIDIYDMRGQKLFSRSVPAGNLSATFEMPFNMVRGVYVLNIRNMAGKNNASGKFVYNK
ncbi:MAG: discoidin domain-containing protein [Candidatus Fibromonas sp.]|jgi:hypothetical protein|nr:discoidin domain-containing protein [Candidatus Fibromonas sp.]